VIIGLMHDDTPSGGVSCGKNPMINADQTAG
jgi:hypothetical protein